jgi:hypothetical protein
MEGDWRRLHNEELHNLYASPYIIRVYTSRKMRLVVHVTRMGEVRCIQNFGGENLMERNNLEDISVDMWIILEWILEKSRDSSVGIALG